MTNDRMTNTDFTLDIARAKNGRWVDEAMAGRRAGTHAELRPVDLSEL